MKSIWFPVACLLSTAVLYRADAGEFPVTVRLYDQQGVTGSLVLRVGGREAAVFELAGKDEFLTSPVFSWAPGEPVSLAGAYKPGKSFWTRTKKGEVGWQVADLSPMTIPLRGGTGSLKERFARFMAAKEAFELEHKAVLGDTVSIDVGEVCSRDELVAAEKRLGFALPAEHAELLETVGAVVVQDSFFMPATSLDRAFDQMVNEWGTPLEELQKLPRNIQELLHASVILFTSVGDGYGGVLYRPAPAGGTPDYLWLHQDDLRNAERLLNQRGEPRTYGELLIHIFAREGFFLYEPGPDLAVIRDFSTKATPLYNLVPDSYADGFSFALEPVWETLE